MKKYKKLVSLFLAASLIVTSSVSAFASAAGENIQGSLNMEAEEIESATEEEIMASLMSKAVISENERLSEVEVNSIMDSGNVSVMGIAAAESENLFAELNPAQTGIEALEEADYLYYNENYVYTTDYVDGVLYQWIYFPDGSVRKAVSQKQGDVVYLVTNENNETVTTDNSENHTVEQSLTDEEVELFYEKLANGEVEEKESYSIEDVREALYSGGVATLGIPNDETIFDGDGSIPKKVNSAGCEYTEVDATKPLSAYYIGTYYKTIPGLSEYNNGYDRGSVKMYDTRLNYVKNCERTTLFSVASDILSIVSFATLLYAKVVTVLDLAGVVVDAAGLITEPVQFYAEEEYSVYALREATIYDYTMENAYVELPQLESLMGIGIVYLDYTDGVYHDAQWAVIDAPEFSIPSEDIDNATRQQYADYAVNFYYVTCNLNGWWIYGRGYWYGLGG